MESGGEAGWSQVVKLGDDTPSYLQKGFMYVETEFRWFGTFSVLDVYEILRRFSPH